MLSLSKVLKAFSSVILGGKVDFSITFLIIDDTQSRKDSHTHGMEWLIITFPTPMGKVSGPIAW